MLLVNETPDLLQLLILLLLPRQLGLLLLLRQPGRRQLALRLRPNVLLLAEVLFFRRPLKITFGLEKIKVRRSFRRRRSSAGNALRRLVNLGVLLSAKRRRRRRVEVEVVVLVSLDGVDEAAQLVEQDVVAGTRRDDSRRRNFRSLKIKFKPFFLFNFHFFEEHLKANFMSQWGPGKIT